ncbi:MAG: hypothetical protein IJX26_03480, partial [Clostridia bacterium]|nr:hypothetical protein [Clostridia bacterium]
MEYNLTMLNEISFGTAILYVLAVLLIMAVAGGIVFLLSGAVVSIIDKKQGGVKPTKEAQEVKKTEEKLLLESKDFQLEDEAEVKAEPKEIENNIDMAAADREQQAIMQNKNSLQERTKILEENADKLEETEENEPEIEEDDLEAMYQKLIADINAEATQEESKE